MNGVVVYIHAFTPTAQRHSNTIILVMFLFLIENLSWLEEQQQLPRRQAEHRISMDSMHE